MANWVGWAGLAKLVLDAPHQTNLKAKNAVLVIKKSPPTKRSIKIKFLYHTKRTTKPKMLYFNLRKNPILQKDSHNKPNSSVS